MKISVYVIFIFEKSIVYTKYIIEGNIALSNFFWGAIPPPCS